MLNIYYWGKNVCTIFRFIIHNCVPPIALEMDDPNEFEIPAIQRRKVTETILETCRDSISDSLTGTCKDNFKVFFILQPHFSTFKRFFKRQRTYITFFHLYNIFYFYCNKFTVLINNANCGKNRSWHIFFKQIARAQCCISFRF